MCVYMQITDCVEIVYELTLPSNNRASGTFLRKSGQIGRVDWVFVIETPSCR